MTRRAFLRRCTLCPRGCGVDRTAGETGVCGAGATLRVARAALHHWEEPCISGKNGSGTIFFSHCPLQCVYCQNREISMGGAGKDITFPQLAQMLTALQGQGAHNINLVTGTHYAPHLVEAMRTARKAGLRIPVIWNSGGYETDQTLALLQDTVDVYLPDLKYFSRDTALRYSRAGDYVETAKAAIRQMFRQAGACVFDGDGMIVRGVIVRHLVLPGRTREAKEIIRYLHGEYGNEIYLSIMNQYTPVLPPGEYPELERKLSKREYEDVLEFALKIGVENAYVQEGGTAKESFIPPFHEDLF